MPKIDVPSLLMQEVEALVKAASDVQYSVAAGNYSDAARHFGAVLDAAMESGADIAQQAYNHGMTKKAICEAMRLKQTDLRGMTKNT